MENFPQRPRLLHLGNGRRGGLAAEPDPRAPDGRPSGGGARLAARAGAGPDASSPGPARQVGPRLGPRPRSPEGAGWGAGEPRSGAAPPPADAPSETCAPTFCHLVLSSRGAAVDLELGGEDPGRGVRAAAGRGAERTVPVPARSPLPLPRGAHRGGGTNFLDCPRTVVASPAPGREEEPRPLTGTWRADLRFALEGLFYFRGYGKAESRSIPCLRSPTWREEQEL